MSKKRIPWIVTIVLLFFWASVGFSQTGYVSDMLLLTFRSGPGNSYEVLKTLKSNTRVSVLDEESGYFKVSLDNGDIGWVDKKFIIFDLPKALVVNQLEKKNQALEAQLAKISSTEKNLLETNASIEASLNEKIKSLSGTVADLEAEKSQLAQALEKSRTQHQKLIQQSRDIQNIIRQNEKLTAENQALQKNFETVSKKHKNSFRTAMIKWFLAGVGVLLIGWVIGNSVSSKKRHSGGLLD